MPNQIAGMGLGAGGALSPMRRAPQRGGSVMGRMGQWVPPDHPDAMHDPLQAQPPQPGGDRLEAMPPPAPPQATPQQWNPGGGGGGDFANAGGGTIGDLYSKMQAPPPQPQNFGSFVGGGNMADFAGAPRGPLQFDPNMGGDIAKALPEMRGPEMAMGQGAPMAMGQPSPMAMGRARGGFAPQRGRLSDLLRQRQMQF